jgi:hypothetical protein
MRKYPEIFIIGILNLVFLIACQDNKAEKKIKPKLIPAGVYTECKDPRPKVCTQEFRPVCGKVDTGVRCITTPCPSTKNKTYSNACIACTDSKAYGFWKNVCPE